MLLYFLCNSHHHHNNNLYKCIKWWCFNKNERDFAPWSQVHNLETYNLQLGNLKIWKLDNLARNAELTFNFGNFQNWELSILATFNFGFNFGNFHFISFISSISFNFTLPISFYQNLSNQEKKIKNVQHHTTSKTSKHQLQIPVVWILRSKIVVQVLYTG